MSIAIRLAVPCLLVSACAARASYVGMAPAGPPRPSDTVAIMFGSPPLNCAYREVGYVEGESNNQAPADALEAMRVQAGRRGADAIVLIDHQDPSGHHVPTGHNFSAVAITFVGMRCEGTGLLPQRSPVAVQSPPVVSPPAAVQGPPAQ